MDPTFFELFAVDHYPLFILSSFEKILNKFIKNYPWYSFIQSYHVDIFYFIKLLVDRYYIKYYNTTIALHSLDLCFDKLSNVNQAPGHRKPLSRYRRYLILIAINAIPYFFYRARDLYLKWTRDYTPDGYENIHRLPDVPIYSFVTFEQCWKKNSPKKCCSEPYLNQISLSNVTHPIVKVATSDISLSLANIDNQAALLKSNKDNHIIENHIITPSKQTLFDNDTLYNHCCNIFTSYFNLLQLLSQIALPKSALCVIHKVFLYFNNIYYSLLPSKSCVLLLPSEKEKVYSLSLAESLKLFLTRIKELAFHCQDLINTTMLYLSKNKYNYVQYLQYLYITYYPHIIYVINSTQFFFKLCFILKIVPSYLWNISLYCCNIYINRDHSALLQRQSSLYPSYFGNSIHTAPIQHPLEQLSHSQSFLSSHQNLFLSSSPRNNYPIIPWMLYPIHYFLVYGKTIYSHSIKVIKECLDWIGREAKNIAICIILLDQLSSSLQEQQQSESARQLIEQQQIILQQQDQQAQLTLPQQQQQQQQQQQFNHFDINNSSHLEILQYRPLRYLFTSFFGLNHHFMIPSQPISVQQSESKIEIGPPQTLWPSLGYLSLNDKKQISQSFTSYCAQDDYNKYDNNSYDSKLQKKQHFNDQSTEKPLTQSAINIHSHGLFTHGTNLAFQYDQVSLPRENSEHNTEKPFNANVNPNPFILPPKSKQIILSLDSSKCSLCCSTIRQFAVTSTGFVACFHCLQYYVENHKQCPFTHIKMDISQVNKLRGAIYHGNTH